MGQATETTARGSARETSTGRDGTAAATRTYTGSPGGREGKTNRRSDAGASLGNTRSDPGAESAADTGTDRVKGPAGNAADDDTVRV